MPSPQHPLPPPEKEPVDLANLLRGIRGDEALLARLVANFLADTPPRVDELRRMAASRTADGLGSATHSLRGSLTVFGAERAMGLARQVEQAAREGDWAAVDRLVPGLEAEVERVTAHLARRLEIRA